MLWFELLLTGMISCKALPVMEGERASIVCLFGEFVNITIDDVKVFHERPGQKGE